jgi:hypothetical protein
MITGLDRNPKRFKHKRHVIVQFRADSKIKFLTM